MQKLTNLDALNIAHEYYEQFFNPEDAVRIVAILVKVDIAGLIQFAHNVGATDERLKRYD